MLTLRPLGAKILHVGAVFGGHNYLGGVQYQFQLLQF